MRQMFSKKQIEEMIKNVPAEVVVEALQGQDLKVKTLEQNTPNFLVDDDNFTLNVPEGINGEKGYCRIEVINGVLYIVVNVKLTNTTESSISVGNLFYVGIVINDTDICSKLIDVNGKDLNDTSGVSSLVPLTADRYFQDNGSPSAGFYSGGNVAISRIGNQAKVLRCVLRDFGSVQSGASHNVTFRTFLTIL